MATTDSLPGLLSKLQSSLNSVATSMPDPATTLPPADGISLFDVKTELFLSYLQNLVFLILLKIRKQSGLGHDSDGKSQHAEGEEGMGLNEATVKKLVELRVYLDRGVKPLEGRLKYQVDKVLRAADHAVQKEGSQARTSQKDHASDDSGGDSSSDESIDELSYRPNAAAFTQSRTDKASKGSTPSAKKESKDGVYRPPKITPTVLPSIDIDRKTPNPRRRPMRSSTVDEYLTNELSNAPVAEPSVGSTITAGGRRNKSAKEREIEDERRAYEEANFKRLMPESKKERRQRGMREQAMMGFGGEELRGLGEGADRITKATAKRGGKRPTEDGPRGDGFASGTRFGKMRKMRR